MTAITHYCAPMFKVRGMDQSIGVLAMGISECLFASFRHSAAILRALTCGRFPHLLFQLCNKCPGRPDPPRGGILLASGYLLLHVQIASFEVIIELIGLQMQAKYIPPFLALTSDSCERYNKLFKPARARTSRRKGGRAKDP